MIDIEFSTIAFTIINLIVLFLLLKKFLIGPLNDVIKKREFVSKPLLYSCNIYVIMKHADACVGHRAYARRHML